MAIIRNDDLALISRIRFVNMDPAFNPGHIYNGVSIDSRRIEPGQIFWAIKGNRFDGHDFVKEALRKRAALCVVSEKKAPMIKPKEAPLAIVPETIDALQELAMHYRRRFAVPVIAITGSNGKTTVKEMAAHILMRKFNVLKTEGNLNNHIGCPLTLLRFHNEHQAAVIELGTNRPGEIAMLTRITQPTSALITNVGPAHLAFFKSVERVAEEKLALFDGVSGDGTILKNLDDPYLRVYKDTEAHILTYAVGQKAQVRANQIQLDSDGCPRWRLNDMAEIRLQTPGLHNVYNALAAAAIAIELGFTEQEIAESLQSYQGFEQRMQVLNRQDYRIINDSYNANPGSFRAAFETLAKLKRNGALYLVLGDMFELGEDWHEQHKAVLQQAYSLEPDGLYVMGECMQAAAEALGGAQIGNVRIYSDHYAIAKELDARLKKHDIVFIKGSRGMKMEQVVQYLSA